MHMEASRNPFQHSDNNLHWRTIRTKQPGALQGLIAKRPAAL